MCISISQGNSQYINTILHPKVLCTCNCIIARDALHVLHSRYHTLDIQLYSSMAKISRYQNCLLACISAFKSQSEPNILPTIYLQNLFFARYVSEVPSVNLVGGDGVHPRTKCKMLPSGWCVGGHWFTRAHFRLQSRVQGLEFRVQFMWRGQTS